ncbi:hypothetical protein pb186bvf_019162 [Paramecium bursaria]
MSIQATNYEVEDMGRYFKSSKKKYKWTFQLDDKSHFLELEFSYLSGKRKLALDGRTLHESMMLTSSFQYPFTLEGFALNVIQQGDSFELRINNKVFSHLFTQQKTQNEFVYEDKVNQKQDTYENNFSQQGFNQVPNSNKFSLNFKMDPTPKEQQAPKSTIQAPKITNALGQTAVGWEDFEQFGQQVTNNPNPFGNFNTFDDFNQKPAQQAPKQQKIDLLDLDEPVTQTNQAPPKQEQQQPPNLFDTLLFGQQQPQQAQNFGFQQAQPFQQGQQQPQQNVTQQIQQPSQPQQQFQQPQQAQNAFEAFGQPQQQQFNIMNLYGPQQVQGNLAYHNFPSLNPQPPQQIPPAYGNQQATPFDVFK